ncbi:hypothetical protein [Nocardioides hwasunensis]|uniref:Glycosyltransferase RgtA/B/C/D-like domain-containing protein n=1 Tax=Nocardioides hwasunensis TaxID=397258 RepID=A0ABR8MLT8_9ACTN|nr:hypothetical protein [Nocardioides hwasunensis]MBD3915765.1 hypothetical protein [Nocardioides hwasunensis]
MSASVPHAEQAHVREDGHPSTSDAPGPGLGTGQRRRPAVAVGLGVIALLASCAIVVGGGSPAALVLVAVAVSTLALRCWLTTALAFATVLSGALALVAVSMRVAPVIGVPVTWLPVLPAVAAAVALVVLWLRRSTAFAVDRSDLVLGAVLVALSLVQVVAVPVVRWLSGSPKLAWMMNNDSVWNLVSARFIVEDGGLVPVSHRNPAPLANEVVAFFMAPGRSGVDRTALLEHDLYRASEVLLLLVGATSLLAGLVVAAGVPSSRRWSRAVLTLVAAAIPWTWSLAGQVFLYGFWNSLPAAILILAAWAAWTSSDRFPVTSSGLLALIGTGLLASWAPLVLAPAALGVAVVCWRWRAHLDLRGLAMLAWLSPLALLVAYAGFVTRADFAAASGGLAAEGLFPPFGQNLPPVFWLVPFGVLVLLSTWSTVRIDLVGAVVVGLAGAVGTHYLMGQRAGAAGGPWGYYPQKFAWTLALLAPLLVLLSVRGGLAVAGLRRIQQGTLVLGSVALAGTLLLQVPPADPRPVTGERYPVAHGTPDYRLSSMLPVVSISLSDRSSALDPAVDTLLRFEDPDRKVVVSRWSPEPGDNTFVNYWLLQLPVDRSDEMPRPYAYGLDSFDPSALCDLVRDWGGGVVIQTRSDTLDDEMRALCPRQDFEVRVH